MSSFARTLKRSLSSRNSKTTMQGKENAAYVYTPVAKKMNEVKPTSTGLAVRDENTTARNQLRRNTTFTKSFRCAVGTIRQKLRNSTRQRKRLHDHGNGSPATPGFRKIRSKQDNRTPKMKGGYREVKMYSPFGVDTPRSVSILRQKQRGRWHDVETPTRLRKEVEDLTSNLQALVALTPDTLMTRAQSRKQLKQSPLSNSSKSSQPVEVPLRPPRKVQARRKITTEL